MSVGQRKTLRTSFAVKSSQDAGVLEFSGTVPRGLTGYDGAKFCVRLATAGLSAFAEVYDIQPHRWAEFFGALAIDWPGWEGERSHESLEHHLRIDATSDRLGHIRLHIHLRDDPVWRWHAEADVFVEAGQLDQLAKQAKAFFG